MCLEQRNASDRVVLEDDEEKLLIAKQIQRLQVSTPLSQCRTVVHNCVPDGSLV